MPCAHLAAHPDLMSPTWGAERCHHIILNFKTLARIFCLAFPPQVTVLPQS